MIITAKFAAVCPCCSGRINAGDKIEWSKGEKAKHASCAGKPVTATVSRPNYRTGSPGVYRRHGGHGRFVACEGWGSDNPHAPRSGHCSECAACE